MAPPAGPVPPYPARVGKGAEGVLRGGAETVIADGDPLSGGLAEGAPIFRPYVGVSPQVREKADGFTTSQGEPASGELPAAELAAAVSADAECAKHGKSGDLEVFSARSCGCVSERYCVNMGGSGVGARELKASAESHERAETASKLRAGADVRGERLAQLARLTAAHRARRAAQLMKRERAAPGGAGRYYRDRARAQLRRWDQVALCEADAVARVWAVCKSAKAACTPEVVGRCGCGVERACRVCRVELVREKRAQAERAIEAAAELYAPELARAVNPWAWRMVTLTVPPGLGIDRDVADMARMLADLRRWVNAWILNEGGEREWRTALCRNTEGELVRRTMSPPWLAHLEITKGEERRGHTHAHLAICSPYIPAEVLRYFWGKALERRGRRGLVPHLTIGEVLWKVYERGGESWRVEQVSAALVTRRGAHGRQLATVPWPITDVRRAYGSSEAGGLARELCKYVVKDVSDGGESMPVDLEADIYCALDGRRTLLSQRGFWGLGASASIHSRHCEECGECSGFMVWLGGPEAGDVPPRAPPLLEDPCGVLRGHLGATPFPMPRADGAPLPPPDETPEAADLRVASYVVHDPTALLDSYCIAPRRRESVTGGSRKPEREWPGLRAVLA